MYLFCLDAKISIRYYGQAMFKKNFSALALFLLLILLFISGCNQQEAKKIYLTEYFSHFSTIKEKEIINFDEEDHYSNFSEGWSKPKQKPSRPFLWALGPNSTLQVFLSERKDYKMQFVCKSNADFKMNIFLNEKPCSTLYINQGKNLKQVALLRNRLKRGLNHIRFNFFPTKENQNKKSRIQFRRIDLTPISLKSEPGIQILPESNTVKIRGPLYGYFFIKTGYKSCLKFQFRSSGEDNKNHTLKIDVENFLGENKDRFIKLNSSQWKTVEISLKQWDNQTVKISFQHLVPEEQVTEIINPVLEIKEGTTKRRKILVIGLDGADWNIINPLLKAGKLPNLKKVITSGVSGPLLSVRPMYSPLIWTSIVTGKTMQKHGISGFLEQQRRKGEIIPNSCLNRKCHALWNILSNHGFSLGLIGPWVTWPAEIINGYVLSDRMYFEDMDLTTYPRELRRVLFQKIKPLSENEFEPAFLVLYKMLEPINMNLRSTVKQNIRNEKLYIQQDRLKAYAGLYFNDIFHPDFTFIYLRGPDVTSHFFWKYFEPDSSVPAAEINAFANLIPQNYIYQDYVVGRYLDNAGPETTTIIVSDHGMTKKDYSPKINFYKAPDLWKKIGILDSISRFNRRQEQLLLVFKSEASMNTSKERLEKIKFAKTGTQLFKVTFQQEKNSLLLEVKDKYEIDGQLSLKYMGKNLGPLESFAELEEISGNHSPYGVLIMQGEGIKENQNLNDCSVLDITPTILHLMGLPVGKDMDGRGLKEAFTQNFLNQNPVRFLDSYEKEIKILRRKKEPISRSQELEKELIKRLRALGYVK